MARVAERKPAAATGAWLEVERLELADQGRLVVTGRWFGVRGRRFVRPTVTLLADGERHRLLADLGDKPWAANDGELWRAAFPWELDAAEIAEVELAVATDIVIPLNPPGSTQQGTGRPGASPSPAPELVALRRQLEAVREELAAERREVERLGRELEQAQQARVETAAALARRDLALQKPEEMAAERDRAIAALDAIAAERDPAPRAPTPRSA
jgi:hypothetical protein